MNIRVSGMTALFSIIRCVRKCYFMLLYFLLIKILNTKANDTTTNIISVVNGNA